MYSNLLEEFAKVKLVVIWFVTAYPVALKENYTKLHTCKVFIITDTSCSEALLQSLNDESPYA